MKQGKVVEREVACSLSAQAMTDRRQTWQRLSDAFLRDRRATVRGMELTFADADGVEDRLRELAALEAECCSFADWKVGRREDGLVLEVTAPASAVPAVHALFDQP